MSDEYERRGVAVLNEIQWGLVMVLKGKTTPAEKRRNLYTSSSKYRNWPRLGLWAESRA